VNSIFAKLLRIYIYNIYIYIYNMYFDIRGSRGHRSGEDYVTRSFMIFAVD